MLSDFLDLSIDFFLICAIMEMYTKIACGEKTAA